MPTTASQQGFSLVIGDDQRFTLLIAVAKQHHRLLDPVILPPLLKELGRDLGSGINVAVTGMSRHVEQLNSRSDTHSARIQASIRQWVNVAAWQRPSAVPR
jgi:hypothetical protein